MFVTLDPTAKSFPAPSFLSFSSLFFLFFLFFFFLVRFIKFKMSWKSCSACTEGMAQSLEILVCCTAPEL